MTDEQDQLIRDYKETFGSPCGQRVLEDLKKKSKFDRSSVRPEVPIDLNRVLYDEAQRAVIRYIVDRIKEKLDEPRPTEAVS